VIRWTSSQARLAGFTFYPVLEIAFGLFLVMSALAVPLLFLRFNGLQGKQWPELLFCLGFLLFFGWMGKTLIFQAFLVRVEGGNLVVEHNLRDPAVSCTRPLGEWEETTIREATDGKGDRYYLLVLVAKGQAIELYRSINSAEIVALHEALVTLQQNAIPAPAPPATGTAATNNSPGRNP
jgi:hypothetical protein